MFKGGANVFGMLAKPLQRLLAQRGFTEPTRPQSESIPSILDGKNVLLIAPAGTGKTEAAFMPVLHHLLSAPRERGIKAIYITPLRALNRDMFDRLEWWCRALDLKVSVRHGDTALDERRKQAISPPDIMITTPETFQVVLMGRRLSHYLGTVRWVIIDEVHELAEDKRGAQLSLSLERLRRLKAGDFQIIGLSATIGSPDEVAKFLVGEGRQCEVIDVSVVRELKLDVLYPAPTRQDEILASDLYTFPQVAARLRAMRKLIEGHGSTLVFTNTRPMAEVLASRFRLWDLKFPVSIHHGSLSSFARLRAEQGLKGGELKGVICVSGDSKVLLADGDLTPIKELTSIPNGVHVMSLSRSLRVQPTFARRVGETGASQLLRILTRSGFELKCTPDHKLLSINKDGELDWIAAQNLIPGSPVALARCRLQVKNSLNLFDFLPDDAYIRISKNLTDKLREVLRNKYNSYVNMAKSLFVSKDNIRGYLSRGWAIPHDIFRLLLREAGLSLERVYPEISWIGSKNYPRARLPLYLNEDAARFIGFLLAEGSLTRRDMLRLFNTDLTLLRRYTGILKNQFGLQPRLAKQRSGTWVATFHSTWLCDLLRHMGVRGGRKARIITVPRPLLCLPASMGFAFLAGYFDGDGCLERKNGRIYSALFYTSSERMAKDLQLMLLTRGIISAVREKEGRKGKEYVVAVLGGRHLRNFLNNCHLWRGYEEKEVVGKGYSHRDCIPNIGSLLESIRKKAGLTTYSIQEKYRINPRKYERNERAISKEKLDELISVYGQFTDIPQAIRLLLNSDIFWDPVHSIGATVTIEPVYDVFDVKDMSNFVVNGFITHNCTSSMELGLDIGKIDLVLQYNSPRQVTRLLQRVGRSGHRIGGVAKGAVVVQDPDDALESVVIASRSYQRELEPVSIPEKPLDVLMHTLVGMMAFQRRVGVDDAYEIICRAHPFKDLTKEEMLEVIRYMQSLSKRLTWLSPDEREFVMPRGRERVFDYYFNNLSMIPELRQYLVVDDERDEPVGVLDESFIAEYGSPGVKFVMAGKLWRIVQVFKDKVYVKPDEDPLGAIPTWIGEEIPVPYSVAQEVGRIKSQVEELAEQGLKLEEISRKLAERYGVKAEVMELALADALKQAKQGLPLPTHDRVTIEKFEDIHVIHAHFGTLVNRTLARLLAYKASEELGETTAISVDPYRILLKSESLAPEQLLEIMKGKLGADFEKDLRSIIEESRFFSWRIVQVARRMGVLEEEAEISSKVVDKLMRGLRGTPAYEETFKEVVHKDLDLDLTVEVLERMRGGEMELVSLGVRKEPTPMSSSVLKQRYIALEPVAPERLRLLAVASARARLLSEVRTFVCVECGQYIEEKHIHELDDKPRCPKCKSSLIGMVEETPEEVQRVLSLLERLPAAGKRNELWKEVLETSRLISKHGKLAAVALVGRGVTPEAAREILEGEKKLSGKFLELILSKEREALLRRFRWA